MIISNNFQDYVDNIGENIYAKSASASKSKSRKMSQQGQKKRNSSVSNELSSLANQLNISNDILADEPVDEADETVEVPEETEASTADDEETPEKTDIVVDEVDCSITNENVEIESVSDDSSSSEFVHLKKTTTALQSYLEQFQMENIKSNSLESSETFDATEELLKMLETDNTTPS